MNIIQSIQKSKKDFTSGTNSIKFGMPVFDVRFPGVIPESYGIITAGTKAGKTNFMDHYYVYSVYSYCVSKGLIPCFLYFSLELSSKVKTLQYICNRIYTDYSVRVSKNILRSLNRELTNQELELVKSTYSKVEAMFNTIELVTSVATVEEITKTVNAFAGRIGTLDSTGNYKLNAPNLFPVVIIDSFNLLESTTNYRNTKSAIDALSKYIIKARNMFKFSFVAVQQQAADQESREAKIFNNGYPTIQGLGESKFTVRDADYTIGIYSPGLNNVSEWKGYDITKFGDHFRTIEILRDRDGNTGWWTPLYYDGAVNFWQELPPSNSSQINEYYSLLKTLTHV